jgi:arsenite methyltransferase
MQLVFAGRTIDLLEKLYLAPQLVRYRQSYLARLGVKNGSRILDVGIGTAANSLLLLQQHPGAIIEGTDRSFEMLHHSRQKLQSLNFRNQIRLFCMDAHQLNLPAKRYDYALVSQVVSYLDDPVLVLTNLAACMKDGGRILLEDSDWESFIYNSGGHPAWFKIRNCWLSQSKRIDGGRRLKEFALKAGLRIRDSAAFCLQDHAFHENNYGYWLAMIIADYVTRNGALDIDEAQSWLTQLSCLSTEGGYYFGLNRMSVIAESN